MSSGPESLWIYHSRQDDERCDALHPHLEAGGYKVGCAHRLLPGADIQGEAELGLRGSRWVVVLACAELLETPEWLAAERVLSERATSVLVVRQRAHQHEWAGFRVVMVPREELPARLLLHLRGAKAPEARHYRNELRRQHEPVVLWRLREAEAQGTREVPLQRLYVPPLLQAESKEEPPRCCKAGDLLRMTERRLLVRGEAGLGKSTLLHHLLLQALEQPELLPVWLTAESAADAVDLEQHLLAEMERQGLAGRWLLEDALADGKVLLLVDGLDEVAQHRQQRLIHALCVFGDRRSSVRMVLTTRPQAQVQVPGAHVLDLLGLESTQIALLWHKLGEATGQVRPAFTERWERWSAQLRDLARIPLLLILLRQIESDEGLRSRVQVYHEALGLLEERWGALRNQTVARPVPTLALREGLERIALHMQDEEKESLPRAKLESLLREALGSRDEAVTVLREALTVGLLRPAEPGALAFIHATFREYLAALALLADEERWQARLPRLRGEAHWREVLYLVVAQRGVVEGDAAQADQRLRDVLKCEPSTMSEVLYGPLCLVAEMLSEGVGASRTLQAEMLERLRAVFWLDLEPVERVIALLSQHPELPWDPAWHGMVKRWSRSIYDVGHRLTTWLAARSEPARAACVAALESSAEPSLFAARHAPELAALGLVMAGETSPRVLDALAGWGAIRDDSSPQLGSGHGLAERLTQQALRCAAQKRPCPPWGRALLTTLYQRLHDDVARSSVGAAWLLASADVWDSEIITVLWRSSTTAAAVGERQRSREVLARLATRAHSVEEELFQRWQQGRCGPDPSIEWLTDFLLGNTSHRAQVVEQLLDLVIGEDSTVSEWAAKQLRERRRSTSHTIDEAFDLAVRRRALATAPWNTIAQSRLYGLFYSGAHPLEVWREVLRARMEDKNSPEVRLRAGLDAIRLSLDEEAIPGLVAGFAVDPEDAAYGLATIRGRQPALHDRILEETRRALSLLPPRGCYEAAAYLYRWNALPWREVVRLGFDCLGETQGYDRLQLVDGLHSSADREMLSLTLVPLLDDKRLWPETQRVLRSLRPLSPEVLLAFVDKLSTVSREDLGLYREMRWKRHLAEMVWRVPTLVDCVLERLNHQRSHETALDLLRVAATVPEREDQDEREHEHATEVAQNIRESLHDRLASEPPQRAWLLLRHVISRYDKEEQRVHTALHRCLTDSGLSMHWREIAQRLASHFDEPGPLIEMERTRLKGESPGERLEAVLKLRSLGCLGETEVECVIGLLSSTVPIAVRVAAAGLLIRDKAAASLIQRAGAVMIECLGSVDGPLAVNFAHSSALATRARESGCWPRTLHGQAAFLLLELPDFHGSLITQLLPWLRKNPYEEHFRVAAMILRELRVDPALVAPICIDILHSSDRFDVRPGLLLGLTLGVDARVLLPSVIVVLLRRGSRHADIDLEPAEAEDDASVQAALCSQLRFLQAWQASYRMEDLSEQTKELIHDDASRENLLEAFAIALTIGGPYDIEARVRIAAARLALAGATEEDYEVLANEPGCKNWYALVSLAPGNQTVIRAWAQSISFRGESFPDALWPLVEAEKVAPGSARAYLEQLHAAWLADDDPSIRLEALRTLADLGWLTPAHTAVLLPLLRSEPRWYAFFSGSMIRRTASAILAQSYPEQASAVHDPLLEMISGGWMSSGSIDEVQECIATLQTTRCPRERIVVAVAEWFTQHAKDAYSQNLGFVSFLTETGLFAELENPFGDWMLRVLRDYSPHNVDDYIPANALRLEYGEATTIDGRKIPRLAALPDLLCRALERRLELPAATLQALWHELTLPQEPTAQTKTAMAQVLRCAADQTELRPFATALVERWQSTRRTKSTDSSSS